MKRIFSLILALMMAFTLAACGEKPTPAPDNNAADQSSADISLEDVSGVQILPEPLAVISHADAYEGGMYGFQAETAGLYHFQMTGEELAAWSVYALEEEFTEPARFLTQSHAPVLEESGAVYLAEGTWVYCCCSVNAFTAEPLEEDADCTVTVDVTPGEGEAVYSENLTE